MLHLWQQYQRRLSKLCQYMPQQLLKIIALLSLAGTTWLFLQPQRSEWLLLPLLLLLWSLVLLFAGQAFQHPPQPTVPDGFIARCRYWFYWLYYQFALLFFLLLCLVCLAFSLKLAGVILRAWLA